MSLFKTRDWWSTSVGEEEEFDHGCLCVANIDNSSDGLDKIIIGSHHGILRIYNPRPSKTEGGWSGFKTEDVMLEQSFPQPILQLAAGRFGSGSDNLVLALLHPRKLSIVSITESSAGRSDHGSHYQMQLLYEHALQRTAFNFCYGNFGGVKGRDFICVQSMDGTVSIFEQETFAFSRFLPGALLPGPIQYISRLDSFVTASAQWQVECYKYQVLAVATDVSSSEESQSIKSGKKVTAEWTFNIGEPALDVRVVSNPQAPPSIIILGERNLFCLMESGKMRYMKKLEYDPVCFLPYGSPTEGTINFMMATHTKSLLVYQDVKLMWAAQMEHVPIDIKVGSFTDLTGVIVTLTDTGQLEASYLGTDPAIFIPPAVEARDLNYSEMDAEMNRLQRRIRENAGKAVISPNLKTDDDVQVQVSVNMTLDDVSMASDIEYRSEDPVPSITAKIQLKSKLLVEKVRVDVHAPWPIAAKQTTFNVKAIDPSKPVELLVAFYLKGSALPPTLTGEVSAHYTSATGAPRICLAHVRLPLKLVVKPVYPVKNAVHKVTIDTNKQPINLNNIFPDLLGENAGGQGAALGFQFFGGPIVTILASKTSQRYRLQCDRLEAMWLPMHDLVKRLGNHFNRGKVGDFIPSFDGSLPLQEYYSLIDMHFEYRMNAEKCKELLAQRAAQFRSIQRRLLTRFKDKTPSPLQNLDTLHEGTYRQILALADAIEENDQAMRVAACNLSSGTYLMNFLVKLWTDMSDAEFEVVLSAITPNVSLSDEQGWEETVDSAITHLLRTTLAKTAKDQTVNPSPLGMPSDTTKVKKHIALFFDRLGKGATLVEGSADRKERRRVTMSVTPRGVSENGQVDIPNGDGPAVETVMGKFKERKKKSKKAKDSGDSKLDDDSFAALGLPAMDRPVTAVSDSRRQRNIEILVPDLDDMDAGAAVSNGNEEEEEEIVYN